ncbi:uncharacterized protein isoform X2 [Choristoneura fumiferana]|uniref:uncharacterized protein isoform X2 n=1 Tax=Choristoneura fumiferana TaxID=7141 RepID=UPI003D15E3EF
MTSTRKAFESVEVFVEAAVVLVSGVVLVTEEVVATVVATAVATAVVTAVATEVVTEAVTEAVTEVVTAADTVVASAGALEAEKSLSSRKDTTENRVALPSEARMKPRSPK